MVVSFFINSKNKKNNDRLLKSIYDLISEGDRLKLELIDLDNHLRAEFPNFTRLNQISNIRIQIPSIPLRLTEKIDQNSNDYLSNFRNKKQLEVLCQNGINKFNIIVDDITQILKKISDYNDVIEDVKYYIKENQDRVSSDSIIKFGFDKKNNLICTLCDFGKEKIVGIKNLQVPIFYGKFHKIFYSGMGLMELGVHITCFDSSIEISYINVRTKLKRAGMGTFTLIFLEKDIISELNKRIDKFNIEPKSEENDIEFYHIEKIYGCSGQLDSDTDSKARENFYTKNGYVMHGDYFTKLLKN